MKPAFAAGDALPNPIVAGVPSALPLPRIAVACSGGRDSTALLHATLRAAAIHRTEVVALHVHHGLSRQADAWQAHVRRQCEDWSGSVAPLRFATARVQIERRGGESLEDEARQARYAALARMAHEQGVGTILLGHHRRDQAETWLLQALRGGGIAGLASMPRSAERHGIVWRRPWLDQPRDRIEAYLALHGLEHVEDDSNADVRHARNRVRTQVWPALRSAFPNAEPALAAAAEWAQQAFELLDEIAAEDLAASTTGDGLAIDPWCRLGAARRSNALRAWLRREIGHPAPASLATRLLAELPGRRVGRWPAPAGELRLHAGFLRRAVVDRARPAPPAEHGLLATGPGRYPLPGWQGELRIEPVGAFEPGIPLGWPVSLALRGRSGDDRFQAGAGRPPRSLKKQFQQAGVPAWGRNGPIVCRGASLLFVAGLGMDARVLVADGAPMRFRLSWQAATA